MGRGRGGGGTAIARHTSPKISDAPPERTVTSFACLCIVGAAACRSRTRLDAQLCTQPEGGQGGVVGRRSSMRACCSSRKSSPNARSVVVPHLEDTQGAPVVRPGVRVRRHSRLEGLCAHGGALLGRQLPTRSSWRLNNAVWIGNTRFRTAVRGESETRVVKKVFIHPSFNRTTLQNDFMLVQLKTVVSANRVPAKYNGVATRPAVGESPPKMVRSSKVKVRHPSPLWENRYYLIQQCFLYYCFVSQGFGKTADGGFVSPVLRAVTVPVVSHSTCSASTAAEESTRTPCSAPASPAGTAAMATRAARSLTRPTVWSAS
jgi:Trypsin